MLGTFLGEELLMLLLGTDDEPAEEPLTISEKLMALGELLELSEMLEPLLSLRNDDESSKEPLKIPIELLLDEFPLPNVLEPPEKLLLISIELPFDELTEFLSSLVSFSKSGSGDWRVISKNSSKWYFYSSYPEIKMKIIKLLFFLVYNSLYLLTDRIALSNSESIFFNSTVPPACRASMNQMHSSLGYCSSSQLRSDTTPSPLT